ncbi:serine hydrolase [Numidum massiliense]|uniref:serine hydrolase n=1 Tax=Numidum massiliense TaxID=1522315 RepID=UPI0006D5A791|nr:serine hydrolase [Numidum massiliense]
METTRGTKQLQLKGLSKLVAEKLEEWNVPGAAVAVVKDDEVVMAEGFGYRDVDQRLEVTPETVFAIGSVTKSFTTAAMGVLVDEGKLDWDEPVRDYLPGFKLHDPVATERLTPRDLACHRSGLPRHEFVWYHNAAITREELIERLRYLEPNVDFREKWQYQNLMYTTAGYMAGKLAGDSWEGFVRERLLTPLEMHESNFSVEEMQRLPNYALPYKLKDNVLKQIPFHNIDAIGPAGSINSNVLEMANWVKFQINKGTFSGKSLISEATMATMHTPHMPCTICLPSKELPMSNYGLGWFIDPYRGYHMLHHGGNIDGFSALVSFMPYENIGLVILTNMDASPLPYALNFYIYDQLLGNEAIDWNGRMKEEQKKMKEMQTGLKGAPKSDPIEGTTPSHPLEDYTGKYAHPGYGELKVELVKGKLQVFFNSFALPLTHYHYDTFVLDFEPVEAKFLTSFHTDVHGYIAHYTIPLALEPGAAEIKFAKLPDEMLSDSARLATFAGQYDLEGKQLITVSVKGEKTLHMSIPGQPEYELVPHANRSFNIKNLSGFSVRFEEDSAGKVTGIRLNQPNGEFVAERKN